MSFRVPTIIRRKFLRTLFYSTLPEECALKPAMGNVVNVAIIGAPNSGKSTLINNIVDRKICATSNKVHTTTKLARAMCFENDTQIIFLDTPGVVTVKEQKKYQLPDSMNAACHKSLRCADVVGVVHDISNRWTKDGLHSDVITMLNMVESTPSFLILNKVDLIKSKKQLLSLIRTLTNGVIAGRRIPVVGTSKTKLEGGYEKFSDVFLVSALSGDGVKEIKDYLLKNAKPASFHYSTKSWSDQTPEKLIEDTVRATFMDFLPQELPYNLLTRLEYYEELTEEDKVMCSVSVECLTERLMRLISGAGSGRLQQIKSKARADLMGLFKKAVVLDIHMKVKNTPITNVD